MGAQFQIAFPILRTFVSFTWVFAKKIFKNAQYAHFEAYCIVCSGLVKISIARYYGLFLLGYLKNSYL